MASRTGPEDQEAAKQLAARRCRTYLGGDDNANLGDPMQGV